MATVTKKPHPNSPQPRKSSEVILTLDEGPPEHWILRGFDAIYRFLASLKLAVLCILTLALVLSGATFFESAYGTPAVREYVYQNKAFAVLLAFLATNIFCAATIRFPWKKRQTGFVVTHIGLLVVLGGAFVSLNRSDEGQLGMPEGTTSNEMVRINDAVVKVEKIDTETGKTLKPYELPFRPGAFSWKNDRVAEMVKDPAYLAKAWLARAFAWGALAGLVAFLLYWAIRQPRWATPLWGSLLVALLVGVSAGSGVYAAMSPTATRRDLLSDRSDPFVFAVNDYLASSGEQEIRAEPDKNGLPVVRIALLATAPGAKESIDAFGGRGWFGEENPELPRSEANLQLGRFARQGGPALVTYQYLRGRHADEALDDFLHPPKNPLVDRVARIHYVDNAGKPRTFEAVLPDAPDKKPIRLPDSDIQVTLERFLDRPLGTDGMSAMIRSATGDSAMHVAFFKASKGRGDESPLMSIASLPSIPNPNGEDPADELVRIGYYYPPSLSAKGGPMSGRFAQVDILEDANGKFYWRAIGRDGLMGGPGPIEVGKPQTLATGNKMPMKLAVEVAEYIPKGRLRDVFTPVELPRSKRDNAIPAIQAEMTVDGVTKSLSLLRTPGLNEVNWQTVRFPSGTYRVALDFDRLKLPFSLHLKTFEPGKDPGSGSNATYTSFVDLSDPEMGIKDEPRIITMNAPLTHRKWSFYQSNFSRVRDPETGQPDAMYASFFQVHFDPAWQVIYFGCVLVVLGTFLQFYMRAGLFTDGGKLERQRDEAKAAKLQAKANGVAPPSKPKKVRASKDAEALEDL